MSKKKDKIILTKRVAEKINRQRNPVERWLDRHNHFMELLRTIGSLASILVLLKIFNLI